MCAHRYTIRKQIGKGGMSTIFLVYDSHLHTYWILKKIAIDSNHQQWKQEVEILKQLRHPMLPRLIDCYQEDKTVHLIMDQMKGITLIDYLKLRDSISIDLLLDWGIQLCDVFLFLHEHHPPIFYLDLKPANIMIHDQKLALIDFGASCMQSSSFMQVSYGTKGFAAPEQYHSPVNITPSTDLYALAKTLEYCYKKHEPWYHPLKQYKQKQCFRILRKCMMEEPADRYQSAREVKQAFQKIQKKTNWLPIVFACGCIGVVCYGYSFMQHQQSRYYLEQAMFVQNQKEQVNNITKAIKADHTHLYAYTCLFDVYKQDLQFSEQEEQHFMTHIYPCIKNNKATIKQVAKQVAYLYWYYHKSFQLGQEDEATRRTMIAWFKQAQKDGTKKQKKEMQTYIDLLEFHQLLSIYINEGKERGMYHRYFNQIKDYIHLQKQTKRPYLLTWYTQKRLLVDLGNYIDAFYLDGIGLDAYEQVLKEMKIWIKQQATKTLKEQKRKEELLTQIKYHTTAMKALVSQTKGTTR